jgi:tetracycline repressor-like protein
LATEAKVLPSRQTTCLDLTVEEWCIGLLPTLGARPGSSAPAGGRDLLSSRVAHLRAAEHSPALRGKGPPQCPLGALGGELAETDPKARDAVAAGSRRWEGVLRDGLRSMHERDELAPSADPHDLAVAMLTVPQRGLLMAQIQRDTKPLETLLDAMIARITSASTGRSRNALQQAQHPAQAVQDRTTLRALLQLVA